MQICFYDAASIFTTSTAKIIKEAVIYFEQVNYYGTGIKAFVILLLTPNLFFLF